MLDLRQQLQEVFGLDDFRPAQREVIEDVVAGRDVLCVMPTGAGKSLCYQLPAAVQGGLTVVVSPLIALMQDQVQQMRDQSVAAMLINSSLNMHEQREAMAQVGDGFQGLVYVAPERFYAASFQGLYSRLRPRLLAIDEAHCISMWGHDFRPEYAKLGEVRRQLGNPPTIALTATATEDVRSDIIEQLGLRDPRIYITGFDRPNLRYESQTIGDADEKVRRLIDLLKREPGGGIIYCSTRAAVEEVAISLSAELRDRLILKYHAGMDHADRVRNQDRFMQTAGAIAVATNAFGMGINKPDIRFVIHFNIPGTLEAYYQEAGRAGRDGLPARCLLMFSYQDRYTQEYFIDKIGEDKEDADFTRIEALKEHALDKLETMIRYAQAHRCRRQLILDYFGDRSEVEDCDCDICHREMRIAGQGAHALAPVSDEVNILVRKLLSGIARVSMRGRFGVGMIADVLAGADNERIRKWGFDELSCFGLLGAHSTRQIVAMLHRLIEAGLARQRETDGERFMPVVELTAGGVAVMKSRQPAPAVLSDLIGQGRRRSSKPPAKVKLDADAPLDGDAQRRFDRLRQIRSELAAKHDLPAYCVCHDSTLRLIAQLAPRDTAALEMIKGMGPNKVRMYGEALLEGMRRDS